MESWFVEKNEGCIQKTDLRCLSSVARFRCRTSLALLAVFALPAVSVLTSRLPPEMSTSGIANNNPDKFYLSVTGQAYSYCFTYDPHAADAWMFRTAEGYFKNPP
jgi:hypothetical protein